jgi:hypothetical protein
MPRRRPAVHYNPNVAFPRVAWTIQVAVDRPSAPDLCKQLHAIMQERCGASFYYPEIATRSIRCRYEWLRDWRGRRFAIHLGLFFSIHESPVQEISAYATTDELIENNNLGSPNFSPRFLRSLQDETVELVRQAMERCGDTLYAPRHVLFHLEMLPGAVLGADVRTDDNRIRLFPTKLVNKGKLVSAVCITVNAPSNEDARPRALREVALLCALMTLATGSFCETTNLTWTRKSPAVKFLDSSDTATVEDVYPSLGTPPFTPDVLEPERIRIVWRLYHCLAAEERESFITAVLAYYSGKSIHHRQSTQAIVAYVAALTSLAESRIEKCDGQLTGATCGSLPTKHNIVGEKAAVLSLVRELLVPSSEDEERLKALLSRVYDKQRSAFVHGAELRHEEFHKGSGLPSAFPTASGPVRDLYFYRQDLSSTERVVRRALLQWLAQKTGQPLDTELFSFADFRIATEIVAESCITLPARVPVAPFHDSQRQLPPTQS